MPIFSGCLHKVFTLLGFYGDIFWYSDSYKTKGVYKCKYLLELSHPLKKVYTQHNQLNLIQLIQPNQLKKT